MGLISILLRLFILLGKQEDDDVPGRSSTRVCKPPGGGSSLSLSWGNSILDYINVKFSSSKVTNLNLSHLFLSVEATYVQGNESILLTKLFFTGCCQNLKKYCALELSSSFGASPAKLKGLVYLWKKMTPVLIANEADVLKSDPRGNTL